MARIIRDPDTAARNIYDLIIIGGGIYGAMLSLESSLRGLRSLLIERDDFGQHTSFNSLRIIHGGFRYFQNLDLHRFRESVGERRWFLRTFPDLVIPLPCLMPLYGKGLRRPAVFRIALLLNELLSWKRNIGVRYDRHLPSGQVIDDARTKRIFPLVDLQGLQGGAVWFDAFVPDSHRLLIQVLRWACEYGAKVLNYVEASQLLQSRKSVVGVAAIDRESGVRYEYQGGVVINASGPWCRDVASRFDRDEPKLFRAMLVWNVLLNRKPLSDHGLAVAPKKPHGQTYFLVPWKGMLLAGTGHAPWLDHEKTPTPTNGQLQNFLDDLNLAVPGLDVNARDIVYVFPGLQPASQTGGIKLASREFIYDHAKQGGPLGLYSISGVKFTTARLVAEKTLRLIFPERTNWVDPEVLSRRPQEEVRGQQPEMFAHNSHPPLTDTEWKDMLRSLISDEAAKHLDDLIFRRTALWADPSAVSEISPFLCQLFGWNNSQCKKELARVEKTFANHFYYHQNSFISAGEA